MRDRSWIIKVTIMSVILGMLLAVSLKTQMRLTNEGAPTNIRDALKGLRESQRQNKLLREQTDTLQKKLVNYEKKIAGKASDSILNQELQDSRFRAGLTTVEGQGVVITLQDSQRKVSSDAPLGELIIHDTDIRTFLSELNAAGAEAVSVNGHRIVARSAIRCAGPIIYVNGIIEGSPFEIKAIGDSRTLESALKIPGGVADLMPDPDMVKITREDHVVVQPYTEDMPFRYAKPADQ